MLVILVSRREEGFERFKYLLTLSSTETETETESETSIEVCLGKL